MNVILKFSFIVRSRLSGRGVIVEAFDKAHARSLALPRFLNHEVKDLICKKIK